MERLIYSLVFCFTVVAALPADFIVKKSDPLRFQYAEGPDGAYLVDTWLTLNDLHEVARFDPDKQNAYHLFTRQNPTTSQPLLNGNAGLLATTNFDPAKRTVFLVHGWMQSAVSEFNAVLIPAFLAGEDMNVIVVDWSAGGGTINYSAAVANSVTSGKSVARFIDWLSQATGVSFYDYFHLVGAGLGGQKIGIIGRSTSQLVGYVTALDPALPGFLTNEDRLDSSDGSYVEVIHTNAGINGFVTPLGHTDFYPNGGVYMPGCDANPNCSSDRAIFYMAESVNGGVFTGQRCASYLTAMLGNCFLPGNLVMGGITPKTGSTGIYFLETNAGPPFARG